MHKNLFPSHISFRTSTTNPTPIPWCLNVRVDSPTPCSHVFVFLPVVVFEPCLTPSRGTYLGEVKTELRSDDDVRIPTTATNDDDDDDEWHLPPICRVRSWSCGLTSSSLLLPGWHGRSATFGRAIGVEILSCPGPMHATGGRRLRLVTAFHYKLVVFDKFSAHTAPDQGPDWSTAETCAATRECVCVCVSVHTGHRIPCTRFDLRIVVENELYTEFNVSVK